MGIPLLSVKYITYDNGSITNRVDRDPDRHKRREWQL